MRFETLRIIRDEHTALSAMLQSLLALVRQGPGDAPERYFDVVRAMLFYIDEFPEKLHHPKESNLLFPRVARVAPQTMDTIARLERDHMQGENAVRELQHKQNSHGCCHQYGAQRKPQQVTLVGAASWHRWDQSTLMDFSCQAERP